MHRNGIALYPFMNILRILERQTPLMQRLRLLDGNAGESRTCDDDGTGNPHLGIDTIHDIANNRQSNR
jgi:hypothetical protein